MGHSFSIINLTNNDKKEEPKNDELDKLINNYLKTLALDTK